MSVDRTVQLAVGSIGVGMLVLGLKYAAYVLTGSVALYSDALESIINVATAVAALVALRVAIQPADANHPYGHEKAEYISAVVEGVLVIVAALAIFREAYLGFLEPVMPATPGIGLAVNGVGTLVNAVWGVILVRSGRLRRSPALAADGRHLLADVVTSLGVLAGVALASVTGWASLDPAVAAAVGLHILWVGWRVMKDSVGGLMDEAAPAGELNRIRELISANAEGALEAHDLRTRHAGRRTFIDFHLVVDGRMSVSDAHGICDRLERAIRTESKEALITIHVEPEDKAKHSGIVVL